MLNSCSRNVSKPQKRLQDSIPSMSVAQTNAWMNAENINNGGSLSLSPPHTVSQRETGTQVSQCYSGPPSPCGSTSATPSPTTSPAPPPGAATLDPNWQATKPTVRERNAAMFNNQLMSDVTFIVGGPGMYIYCDEIQLEADTVLSTLYVAKKYIVPHLAKACVNYLETSLTAKNACLLLSQSRLFEEPELMQRCWEVIDAQAEMALTSDGFVDIDVSTLESVLARETLNCKEINLFEAALAWAHAECMRRDIDPTPTNKRVMLGGAIYLIRFPTMSLEEFANSAAQIGILTPQETIDIFLHFTASSKPQLSYPIKARAGLKAQICHRFQSCAYRSNQWRYRGRCDSIQFCVDKRIFVVGFGLYGSSNGAADYNVKIELKRLGRVLAENNTKFFSDGSSNTFHVYFENPIQIEPECFYTASAVLDGSELSYFGQEGLSEVYMGTVTFQFHCSSESTNGTGVQGGQIPELIYYGPTVNTAMANTTTNED
ncbi:hypothetical protein HF086_001032 [Spodoptera exigua]|uniref:BACK domain-containing protein n=1 Tax=Spodoptera exigua TaxID=7107 RepID=A0A922M6K6_SPOEX|nr:hypothetical protein HF086_001032 [Spodoptera exigua]